MQVVCSPIVTQRHLARPRSALAIVLLALIAEEPMHPYRMQHLIKQRGKDRIANVAQPNSVYQTIEGLRRAGLVAVRETARDERRPERTVFEITAAGQATLDEWLRVLLSTPPREFPDFRAALSLVAMLEPRTLQRYLEDRADVLDVQLAQLNADLDLDLPRLFLIEDDYQRAMVQAELDWVRSIVDDLRSGRLSWSPEELRAWAAHDQPSR
jgi:DNA-binding PadR family transcriptional regulator